MPENLVNKYDLQIIHQLETELNIRIPKVDKVDWDTVGYLTDISGRINSLYLNLVHHHFKVKNQHLQLITKLTNLTNLSLDWNGIDDVSALENLTNLTSIHLDGNKIQDISVLKKLINLTNISFKGNHITDIKPLENLINLTDLSFSSKQIQDISALQNLTKLTYLDLSYNPIRDIKPLENLINLTTLYLNNNQIQDISALENLTNLKELRLYENQIQDISALKYLTELTTLYLSINQITEIKPLENLTSLTILYLNNNQIQDISALKKLTNLTIISLINNQIQDISAIENLINLISLSISNNKITDISPLEKLLTNFTWFYSENNPISYIPNNILGSCNPQKVLEYHLAYKLGSDYLGVAKILILGHGRVGKTSLIKSLLFTQTQDEKYKFDTDESITKGFETSEIKFTFDKATREKIDNDFEIKIKTWDFGGQEVQHSTHEHFIHKASTLLALDALDDENDKKNKLNTARNRTWKEDLKEWLNRVGSLYQKQDSDSNSIFTKQLAIVITHIEKDSQNLLCNKQKVSEYLTKLGKENAKNYSDIRVVEYSSKKVCELIQGEIKEEEKEFYQNQIDNLQETIKSIVANNPEFTKKYPRFYNQVLKSIKQEFETQKIHYLPIENQFDDGKKDLAKIYKDELEKFKNSIQDEKKKENAKQISSNYNIFLNLITLVYSEFIYFEKKPELQNDLFSLEWIQGKLYKFIEKYQDKPTQKRPYQFSFDDFKTICQLNNPSQIIDIFVALNLVFKDDNLGDRRYIFVEFLPERELPTNIKKEFENPDYQTKWEFDWMPNSIFLELLSKVGNNYVSYSFVDQEYNKNWFRFKKNNTNTEILVEKGSVEVKIIHAKRDTVKELVEFFNKSLKDIDTQKWDNQLIIVRKPIIDKFDIEKTFDLEKEINKMSKSTSEILKLEEKQEQRNLKQDLEKELNQIVSKKMQFWISWVPRTLRLVFYLPIAGYLIYEGFNTKEGFLGWSAAEGVAWVLEQVIIVVIGEGIKKKFYNGFCEKKSNKIRSREIQTNPKFKNLVSS
jgi:Leucine-rich repeat (LRR) protein